MDPGNDSYLMTINKIDNNLFLGGIMGAGNPNLIASNQITAVVSLLGPNAFLRKHRDVIYLEITIEDLPCEDITKVLPDALNFITSQINSGSNVLIHCAAGVSRSASVAVAYFMVTYNLSYDEALLKVRQGRRCACPNPSFESQLRALESSLIHNKGC